jgi:hypothetical protein
MEVVQNKVNLVNAMSAAYGISLRSAVCFRKEKPSKARGYERFC